MGFWRPTRRRRIPLHKGPVLAGRFRHIAGTKWGTRRYLSMIRLYELERTQHDAA